MASLIHQRCFNHATREAVARCLSCHYHFCRECITEHDDQIICAQCLQKSISQPLVKRTAFRMTMQGLQLLTSVFLLWMFFYLFGQGLISLPSSFHEGTVWRELWIDQP